MENSTKTPSTVKSSQKVPIPLTKKYLAAQFNCIDNRGRTNVNRLYASVLTPDVLATAGLSETTVRKNGYKTFPVTASLVIARALGLLPLLLVCLTTWGQVPKAPERDTTHGIALVLDSVVLMKQGPGDMYFYTKVMGGVFLDAVMIQIPALPAPIQQFYRIDTWQAISPERVMLFRVKSK